MMGLHRFKYHQKTRDQSEAIRKAWHLEETSKALAGDSLEADTEILLEYYLSRGMHIDSFGPKLSFFFSNGMDSEYTVPGRVARRIWSIAMREYYGGSKRAQMLKYHIQTSGRSLHSKDPQFNDGRTTLQARCAIYDNWNFPVPPSRKKIAINSPL